uniref:Uncharacterized protein n=1 Tax=Anguilla anguilla TaxID=7936 RepID=A0A0E9PXD5_ANGAN
MLTECQLYILMPMSQSLLSVESNDVIER